VGFGVLRSAALIPHAQGGEFVLDPGFGDLRPCAKPLRDSAARHSLWRLNVRRGFATALLAVTLAACAPAARAQVFGQFVGAQPLPMNGHLTGVYLSMSDNAWGPLAQLRLSFYPDLDFGFQGGLSRVDFGSDHRTTLQLGGDLKYQVQKAGATMPVDVAVGAVVGVETGDAYSILTLGPSVVASRSFPMGSNASVIPYAGAMLAFSSIDVGEMSDTDFSVPLRFGAEWRFIPEVRIVTELQLQTGDSFNDDVRFAAGVNLPF
jgi:hypothetical protein